MDPFDSSSEDDDFITNVFYSYYFDELDDDDENAVLRTRSAAINRIRATAHHYIEIILQMKVCTTPPTSNDVFV